MKSERMAAVADLEQLPLDELKMKKREMLNSSRPRQVCASSHKENAETKWP